MLDNDKVLEFKRMQQLLSQLKASEHDKVYQEFESIFRNVDQLTEQFRSQSALANSDKAEVDLSDYSIDKLKDLEVNNQIGIYQSLLVILEKLVSNINDKSSSELAALNVLPIPIYYKDNNDIFVFCNEAFARILGLSKRMIQDHSSREFLSYVQAYNVETSTTFPIEQLPEDFEKIELEFIDPQNKRKRLLINRKVVRDRFNQPVGIVGIVNNITTRYLIEHIIRRNEQHYQSIVEQEHTFICRYLPDQTLTFVNKACCQLFNKPREEMVGKNFLQFFPKEDVSEIQDYQANLMAGLETESFVHKVVNEAGEVRWIQWFNHLIKDETTKVREIQSIGIDVTKMKETEKALAGAHEMLLQSEKLATLGILAASICHEINQPLNAIKTSADGLLYWYKKGKSYNQERLLKTIERISLCTTRMEDIVKQIRGFVGNHECVELTELDLNAAVLSALKLVKAQFATHNIVIKKYLSSERIVVWANQTQIEEVVLNILINARQALDSVQQNSKKVCISTSCSQEWAELKIINNGPPIDIRIKEHIFEPLVTTKKQDVGMGLGLAIVSSIVHKLQGEVNAGEDDEGNTVFTVRFPLSKW